MERTSILMVCLGNICRSPLAEGLLRSKLDFSKYLIDSAGTNGYHVDEAPDPRSIEVAQKHGLEIENQKCRRLTVEDFEKFDYIYVMDRMNYDEVTAMAPDDKSARKVKRILDAAFPGEDLDVPDPYHGGKQGFSNVYRMLDKATDKISADLKSKHG